MYKYKFSLYRFVKNYKKFLPYVKISLIWFTLYYVENDGSNPWYWAIVNTKAVYINKRERRPLPWSTLGCASAPLKGSVSSIITVRSGHLVIKKKKKEREFLMHPLHVYIHKTTFITRLEDVNNVEILHYNNHIAQQTIYFCLCMQHVSAHAFYTCSTSCSIDISRLHLD